MKGKKSLKLKKIKFITANDLAKHINTNCETAFDFREKSPFRICQYL